jgi:hypothetical protein
MTYMEIESLDYKAQIKNDFDLGYDDRIKNKPLMSGLKSTEYLKGYDFASGIKGK